MSDLRVDDVAAAAGGTPTNLMSGLVKAWISMDGTGTISTRGSFNVASITDVATGVYDVDYTNNMNDANYSVTLGAGESTAVTIANHGEGTPPATDSVRLTTNDDSAANVDVSYLHTQIVGDLA